MAADMAGVVGLGGVKLAVPLAVADVGSSQDLAYISNEIRTQHGVRIAKAVYETNVASRTPVTSLPCVNSPPERIDDQRRSLTAQRHRNHQVRKIFGIISIAPV